MLKNVLKNYQMSEQYWGCLDKMSEVNFSPAETLNSLDPDQDQHFVRPDLGPKYLQRLSADDKSCH